jgi:tetratricopeptide (TPR) repeat protein
MIRCIGITCSDKREFDRAIVFYKHALRICISFLGDIDAEAAETVTYSGIAYRWKGQHERVLELFERALRICLQVLGPDHRQTLWTQQCMHELRSHVAAIHGLRFRA